MSVKTKLLRFLAYAILVFFSYLGVRIASIIMYRYDLFVKAMMGLVVLILIPRFVRSVFRDVPVERLLVFPESFKYIFFTLVFSIIIYWAMGQITDAILIFF
jgi:hypothetical protein